MFKTKRILVYGFGPYRQFRENVTAKIVKALAPRPGLKKIVFPVRFQRSQFVDAIQRVKPHIILGLGQSSRPRIHLESQATNRRRGVRTDKAKPILRGGPKRLRTTLQLKAGRAAARSANAGDYVCNFSMYVMLEHIQRKGLKIPYGFVHIPNHYDPNKARGLIVRLLRSIT
jgi:pyroglutamyl-peptidase